MDTDTICGADCSKCGFTETCKGCTATCGKPFGGTCVAAEYIKVGGVKQYQVFKKQLLDEVNKLLSENDLPSADELHEMPGCFINLEYPLPNGKCAKLLDDTKIYLGTQISFADIGVCYGVAADTGFILICSYSIDGSEPELVLYKKR